MRHTEGDVRQTFMPHHPLPVAHLHGCRLNRDRLIEVREDVETDVEL
jgi:hypothetical protein